MDLEVAYDITDGSGAEVACLDGLVCREASVTAELSPSSSVVKLNAGPELLGRFSDDPVRPSDVCAINGLDAFGGAPTFDCFAASPQFVASKFLLLAEWLSRGASYAGGGGGTGIPVESVCVIHCLALLFSVNTTVEA